MRHDRGAISHRELQQYLAELANGSEQKDTVRQANLLFSFAELKFRMGGGGKCSVCRAHVRHVLPVEVERENGTRASYECLCTRCLVAEKMQATRVTLRIGNASVEYTRPSRINVASEGAKPSKRAASGSK
jgi:bacterioferritin-associated ferredoxin